MNDSAWNEVVAQLTDDDAEVDTWVAAATRIHRESKVGLVSIARASQSKIKGHVEWLLGFCE